MAKTISYKKLWKLLIDKNMSKSELKTVSGVSTASIAKLGKRWRTNFKIFSTNWGKHSCA